jgi:hypothetical protein
LGAQIAVKLHLISDLDGSLFTLVYVEEELQMPISKLFWIAVMQDRKLKQKEIAEYSD